MGPANESCNSSLNWIDQCLNAISDEHIRQHQIVSTVLSFNGHIVTASPIPANIGSLCNIEVATGKKVKAEIVAISQEQVEILPYETNTNIRVGNEITLIEDGREVYVGEDLLGRVVDGLGDPLDDLGQIKLAEKMALNGSPINPFDRQPISEILDVGIRNINALLSLGRGQRVGIVAGSGVGKSILLSMITKSTDADVVVVSLIGERGRELASFSKQVLSSHSRNKVVVVAVPADRSPLLRIHGAKRATTIAEFFRDQGKDVLLITDSLTRVAHAQRELGLALGEQPTSRGYPPSVISLIPNLIERTGTSTKNSGSITAIYTILADGDDTSSDPVVDSARAILDGHIVLSRDLAQQGVYPAIDVNQSVSRVMSDVVQPDHLSRAIEFRKYLSKYNENKDLILMGGYMQGQDLDLDKAVALWPKMVNFLTQGEDEVCDYSSSLDGLQKLIGI